MDKTLKKQKKSNLQTLISNQKGITIITLAVTIIVMVILASVTVNAGTNIIKKANLQNINTNMMLIQAKTKTIEEQAKFNNDTSGYKGTKIANITSNQLIENLISNNIIDDEENCYLLAQSDLNAMGLEKIDIEDGYIVNYDTNEIIYVKGFEANNQTYYKLSEMKDLNIE
jgi:Tfp pilus assembly protein PilE